MQAELRNGIITRYTITYQSQTEDNNGIVHTDPKVRQANLTGLKEFVKYNISVYAVTVKGEGLSSVLVVRTDQDSKWLHLFSLFPFFKNVLLNFVVVVVF